MITSFYTPCRFHNTPAVAVFRMPGGCTCFPEDTEQALCMQHVVRATPLNRMYLLRDLTPDGAFTRWWQNTGRAEQVGDNG